MEYRELCWPGRKGFPHSGSSSLEKRERDEEEGDAEQLQGGEGGQGGCRAPAPLRYSGAVTSEMAARVAGPARQKVRGGGGGGGGAGLGRDRRMVRRARRQEVRRMATMRRTGRREGVPATPAARGRPTRSNVRLTAQSPCRTRHTRVELAGPASHTAVWVTVTRAPSSRTTCYPHCTLLDPVLLPTSGVKVCKPGPVCSQATSGWGKARAAEQERRAESPSLSWRAEPGGRGRPAEVRRGRGRTSTSNSTHLTSQYQRFQSRTHRFWLSHCSSSVRRQSQRPWSAWVAAGRWSTQSRPPPRTARPPPPPHTLQKHKLLVATTFLDTVHKANFACCLLCILTACTWSAVCAG